MLLQERYRLLKQVGKGGFGKTFLAVDEGKFPPVPCVVQQFSLENQSLKAFKYKARSLEELSQHPQIPTLLAHFEENNHFYLVQEYIEGVNLATQVEEVGASGETQIWQLLESLLPVLKFIHDRNIIHRDIKPENIILRTTAPLGSGGWRDLVLVDFGLAKLVTAVDPLIGEPGVGSPEYAAPEQIKGKPVFASDLYSLGVTCIYLLTQIPPFDLFDIANDCWVWREYLTGKVGERLGKIIDKLVQKDVGDRFLSADEVMQAMGIESNTLGRMSEAEPQEGITSQRLGARNQQWQCLDTLTENYSGASGVNSIAISPDGNILASGNDDKTIKLWDLKTKELLYTLSGHMQAVRALTFSPDGILASASDDKTIKLWNLSTFQEIHTLVGHNSAVKSVAFSPNPPGGLLASGSWDKTVKLWNLDKGISFTLSGHQLQVSAVAFSPQGKLLASASLDRTIRLWEIPSSSEQELKNRPYRTLSSHAWAVLTVAFSPDGRILATGSEDNTIKLWDVYTSQVIGTLLGHSWAVVAVAFSSDGETLISGSWDKTVKLWSVSTKKEIATLSGHVDSVSAVAVSPVTQLIASGSRDKTIKLWELLTELGKS
ncbi:serine/threonine-protein kinase [Iningainema tapete]|uniref:serine/threonine-protein kinase n=1 Tax=Iningainema tapete TaxID=2806730 RepID=UPI001EE18D91|nr:serine/threonine-protein kinase [Iningainema tapete]